MKPLVLVSLLSFGLAHAARSTALPPPSVHYFEWGTAAVESDHFEPRLMFSIAHATVQLNALPLGDGTFAQARISCAERKGADEVHRCTFEIFEDDAIAPVQSSVSIAPGERVKLGQIEKKGGARIPVFVVAAANGAVPFPSVPAASPKSHTIAIQAFSQGNERQAIGLASYSFERRADIHRFVFLHGETAHVRFDCKDRTSPSQPDSCTVTIEQPGFSTLSSQLQLAPKVPVRIAQRSPDGQTVHIWAFQARVEASSADGGSGAQPLGANEHAR